MVSKARRVVSFVLACLLTVGGAAAAIWFLFLANVYSFRLAGAAGLAFTVGIIWLYSDFIDATPNDERN